MNGHDNVRLGQAVIDVRSGLRGEVKGNAAPDHEIEHFENSLSICGEIQLPCHFIAWTVLDFTPSSL